MVTKMTISPCTEANGKVSEPDQGKAFTVQINPSDFARNFDITYNTKQASGSSALEPKFSHSSERKLCFELVMDGTGVVTEESVSTQLNKLKSVVFTMVGDEHQPNIVFILWGDFNYYGKLTKMSVQNTMFSPDGTPLRAKVKLEFIQYVTKKEEAKKANRNSPDLTHSVEVMAGDTLPLLCYRIYKDSTYYMEVARINGLSNFRELQPGMRLQFPPLR